MASGAEGGGGAESSAENPAAEGQVGLQRVFHCHQCSRKTFPNAEHIEVRKPLNICTSASTFKPKYRTRATMRRSD